MKVRNLEILEIRAFKVDTKNRKASLKVIFSEDQPLVKEFSLEEDPKITIENLLKWIKQTKKGKRDRDEDEILGGISIVNIKNDEDVLERAPKGFYRLDQRLGNIRGVRTASDYMQAYGQLLTLEETIFKK